MKKCLFVALFLIFLAFSLAEHVTYCTDSTSDEFPSSPNTTFTPTTSKQCSPTAFADKLCSNPSIDASERILACVDVNTSGTSPVYTFIAFGKCPGDATTYDEWPIATCTIGCYSKITTPAQLVRDDVFPEDGDVECTPSSFRSCTALTPSDNRNVSCVASYKIGSEEFTIVVDDTECEAATLSTFRDQDVNPECPLTDKGLLCTTVTTACGCTGNVSDAVTKTHGCEYQNGSETEILLETAITGMGGEFETTFPLCAAKRALLQNEDICDPSKALTMCYPIADDSFDVGEEYTQGSSACQVEQFRTTNCVTTSPSTVRKYACVIDGSVVASGLCPFTTSPGLDDDWIPRPQCVNQLLCKKDQGGDADPDCVEFSTAQCATPSNFCAPTNAVPANKSGCFGVFTTGSGPTASTTRDPLPAASCTAPSTPLNVDCAVYNACSKVVLCRENNTPKRCDEIPALVNQCTTCPATITVPAANYGCFWTGDDEGTDRYSFISNSITACGAHPVAPELECTCSGIYCLKDPSAFVDEESLGNTLDNVKICDDDDDFECGTRCIDFTPSRKLFCRQADGSFIDVSDSTDMDESSCKDITPKPSAQGDPCDTIECQAVFSCGIFGSELTSIQECATNFYPETDVCYNKNPNDGSFLPTQCQTDATLGYYQREVACLIVGKDAPNVVLSPQPVDAEQVCTPLSDDKPDATLVGCATSTTNCNPTISAPILADTQVYTDPALTTFKWSYTGGPNQVTIAAAPALDATPPTNSAAWTVIAATVDATAQSAILNVPKLSTKITSTYFFAIYLTPATGAQPANVLYFKKATAGQAPGQYTITTISTCADLKCGEISDAVDCVEWSDTPPVTTASCSCSELPDDTWTSPVETGCTRTEKCDAQTTCGVNGYNEYSFADLKCSDTCSCDEGYSGAVCETCAKCNTEHGAAATDGCHCSVCVDGYARPALGCSRCTRYVAITITTPQADFASAFTTSLVAGTIQYNKRQVVIDAMRKFIATKSGWKLDAISVDLKHSSATPTNLVIAFIFEGECPSMPVDAFSIHPLQRFATTQTDDINNVQTAWQTVTTNISQVASDPDIQYAATATSTYSTSSVVNPRCNPDDASCPQDTFYGSTAYPCDVNPDAAQCTEEPSGPGGSENGDEGLDKTAVILIAVLVPVGVILIIVVIVIVCCCYGGSSSGSSDSGDKASKSNNYETSVNKQSKQSARRQSERGDAVTIAHLELS